MENSSLLLSAFGGALGALLLRSSVKLAGALLARHRPLAVHECGVPEPIKTGELRHSWGHLVDDPRCKTGKAWEHNETKVDQKNDRITWEHTLFGPYLNDFGKPGYYRVRFRLCAIGFQKNDAGVVILDVVQSRFGTEDILRLLGQRVVRGRDLQGKYQDFDLVFFASGSGVYEYRAAILQRHHVQPESIVRFDRVTVFAHPSIIETL